MNSTNMFRFLKRFDPEGAEGQTPSPPAAQPTPYSPSSTVPAGMVYELARVLAAQQAPAPSAPAPAAPITVVAPALSPEQAAAITQVQADNARLTLQLERMRLDTYQAQAINAVRANGKNLIDAIVRGNTTAEIDQSILIATAEYEQLHRQFAEKNPPPPPPPAVPAAAAPVEAPPPAVPQGTVTSTQVAPPAPSLPGFVSAPGVADTGPNAISQEQLAYFTSSDAIRNGDYAKNRQALHAALRSGMQGPPGQFSLSGQSLPGLVPPSQSRGPAVASANPFAGVSAPQMSPQGAPAQAPTRGVPSAGFPGRAPQPAHFQQEVAPGQYQATGQPSQADMAAARAAAEASLSGRRAGGQ